MSEVFIFNTTSNEQHISVNLNPVGPIQPADPEPSHIKVPRNQSSAPLRDGVFYQSKENTMIAKGPNEQSSFIGINPLLATGFNADLAIYIYRDFIVFSQGGVVLQKIEAS